MNLSDFKGVVSILAVVTTVLQFLSGILVCKQYYANKTTAEATPLPFLCGILSCGLWLCYGLMKPDDTIILVNVIGLTLMCGYLIVFYFYTFKKSSLLKQATACALCGVIVIVYAAVEEDNEVLLSRLGFSASSLTLFTVASPMSKLFYVLRVKNTECLPFPMILMSYFVSLLWCFYGIIEEDKFLYQPNLIGAVLAGLQLSLFMIYPSTSASSNLSKQILA